MTAITPTTKEQQPHKYINIKKMRELKPLLGLDDLNSKSRLVNIKVHTYDGKETLLTVAAGDQVKAIKEQLLGEAGAKDVSNYKVVMLAGNKVLEDQHTIQQEGIVDDDQFLICRKRRSVTSHFRKSFSYSSKGPDLTLIKKCTEFFEEEKGSGATSPPLGFAGMFDFFGELKRILVSLTEVASLVQHVNCEEGSSSSGGASSTNSDEMDTEDIEINVDPLCLQKLLDMGFEEVRSRKALLLSKMIPMRAMEWLLEHSNDEDIDKPLTSDEINTLAAENNPNVKRKRVPGRKKEFIPNPRCVSNLKEMGFEEKDIVIALKISSNNQERALDWLLGDRQVPDRIPDDGLDPDSPLYSAIMDHPVVQLGLTNPRILHAFEDMLENPNNSGQYINDPEIGPVLLQISRIVQSFSR